MDAAGKGGGVLLSAGDVARLLGCGVRSIWRWSDSGLLPRPLALGRLKRWRRNEIERWAENGCRPVERR